MRLEIDGQLYYTDRQDFLSTLEEKGIIGLSEYIQDLEKQADYTRQKVNTDLLSYESQLDEQSCLLNDTIEALTKVVEMIEESKRLDKNNLKLSIEKIISDIYKVF